MFTSANSSSMRCVGVWVLPDYSNSLELFVRLLRDWWREPVDYTAQVQYFKRAMSGAVQILIGLGTGLDAVISAVILLPSASTVASRIAVSAFVVLQAFWAWVWCCRSWPSRSTSLAFVFSADIAIALMVLLDASWVLTSFGFSFFTMLSVFLVFFDGPKVLAGHITWIMLTTAAFAVKFGIAAHSDVVDFTAKTVLSVALVAGSPLGIQAAIWALRSDANESATDPLTGLLNRRGLQMQIGDLLRGGVFKNAHLVVMVADLDQFKSINDTFGHVVGDEVLVRSAQRIKSAVRSTALVARIGGEEFAIVDLMDSTSTEHVADRLLSAVGAPADQAPITASVGVTTAPLTRFAREDDPAALLNTLIEHADHAMFDAKRHGGNAAVHAQPVDSDG
jgi:diguanylate cyclase (GGDEF)-like protein